MRAITSFISSHSRLQRFIDRLGIKIEQSGLWLQRTLGSRGENIRLDFTNYCSSDLGEFHLPDQITQEPGVVYRLPRGDREKVPGFVRKIFDIEGVTSVRVQQYQVSINKAKVFDWDDIKRRAELILREEFSL